MRDRRRVYQFALAFATIGALVSVPDLARGQGFGLNDIGSCAVGRAYAATGAPCQDASVLYWNPGAAVTLSGWSVYLGGAAIGVNGGFTADTSLAHYKGNVPESFPPHLFVNYTGRLGDRAASVGVGGYVPYGLTSQWPNDFPGRFEAQKASLQTFYFQLNFAIDVVPHTFSIGGGPIIGHSSVELKQALDLSQVPVAGDTTFGLLGIPTGTEFGSTTIKGSATNVGWTLGALYRPLSELQIGARFLAPITFNYSNGTATFQQVPTGLTLAANNPLGLPAGTPVDALVAPEFASGGPLVPQGASTTITHPLQAELGIGFIDMPDVLVDLDVDYVGWSVFQTLPVNFTGAAAAAGLNRTLLEDYGNSWGVRLGAEHVIGDSVSGVTIRAGFSYATTPAPPETVTPLLPDMNRYNGSIGLGVPLAHQVVLDIAYLHVFTEGRRGRIVERTSPSETAAELNSGFYNLAADVFSASLRIHL